MSKKIDNTNGYIVYHGTFGVENSSNYYNGSIQYSKVIGDSIEFEVKNTLNVKIIGVKNSNRRNSNHMEVYVDNEPYGYINSYAATLTVQAELINISLTDTDNHRIKIKMIENDVHLDAIEIDDDGYLIPIIGSVLTTPYNNMKRYSSGYINLKYTGTFNDATSSYGNVRYTDNIGDSLEFYFYGDRVFILDDAFTNRSNDVRIQIDNGKEYSISEYGNKIYYYLVFASEQLEYGLHKVKIINSSSNTYTRMGIQYIDVNGYLCTSDAKYIDITAMMTSDTDPAPCTSSATNVSSQYAAWKAFNGTALNGNDCWSSSSGNPTATIRLNFNSKQKVSAISLTARDSYLNSMPKEFDVIGSNDGSTFDTIQSFKVENEWKARETKIFNLDNINKYSVYGIAVKSTFGASYVSLSNIEFILSVNIQTYLLKVDGVYKNYDEETNTLVNVDDPSILNKNIFENECIYDLKKALSILPSLENVKLISPSAKKIKLKAIKSKSEMIVMRNDALRTQLSVINKIFIENNTSSTCKIRLAVSFDSGIIWKTYREESGGWESLPIAIPQEKYDSLIEEETILWNEAKQLILQNGITPEILETIDFNIGSIDLKRIRFAVAINIENYSDINQIRTIKWTASMNSYLQDCTPDEVYASYLGKSIKLHSNIETSKLCVSILTSRDIHDTTAPPIVVNNVTLQGVLTLLDLGIASIEDIKDLNNKIAVITGDRHKYQGYFLTENDRDIACATRTLLDGDWCVVGKSNSEDEKFKGKTVKYYYQDLVWSEYDVLGGETVQINDDARSATEVWSSEKVGKELDGKQNSKKSYGIIIDPSQLVLVAEGENKGFYSVQITHNIECGSKFNLYVYDSIGEPADLTVFPSDFEINSFTLYSIQKQQLDILIEER